MKMSVVRGVLLLLFVFSVSAADTIRPTVSITSPTANARLLQANVRVSGRVTDNVGAVGVDVFVDGVLRTTVGVGANRIWAADVVLVPGPREIAAESFDAAGNRSLRVKVKVTRVESAPLTLRIDQGGTVIGATNNQPLEIGKRYTIRAAPEAGYVFSGWGGAITSGAPSISFTMAPGTELHAKFRATTFTGLFFPHMYDSDLPLETNVFGNIDSISPTNSGFFTLTRLANGTASGKLVMQGKTIPFSGVIIRSDDTADFSIIRYGKRTLYLSFDIYFDEGLETLRGAIDDGEFVADLAADSVARAKNPLIGKYNFEMTPRSGDSTSPSEAPPGASVGGIRITAANALITGSLADGTPIFASSKISAPLTEGESAGETYLPFYVSLQAGRGMVIGWMTLDTNTNLVPHVLGPRMHWFKAPAPYDKFYRDGFSVSREVTGFRYSVPGASQTPVGWTDGTLYFDFGNLQAIGDPPFPEIQKGVIASRTKLTVIDDPSAPPGTPSAQDLKALLYVNPAEGTVTGSFRHPVTGAYSRVSAIVLQRPPTAERPSQAPYISGYFLGTDQTGDVVIVKN